LNKRQKNVQKEMLKSEKQILADLEKTYRSALDEVNEKIQILLSQDQTQSKIYQLKYQMSLKDQLTEVINRLHNDSYESIEDYLKKCYEDGFISSMYNLDGYGIPMYLPIDQRNILDMVSKTGDNIKLSKKLYDNLETMKSTALSEISRGIASGLSYAEIARNISEVGGTHLRNAQRIARTEGHRVQEESKHQAMQKAKENGADIVKVWDSTMDGITRPEHRTLNGQIRELEEDYTVNGYSGPHPGGFGSAYMDVNCRCCSLEMPRWALGNDFTKMDNDTKSFTSYKLHYKKG